MNSAFIDKDEIKVAGNWDELEPSQTLQLVPLLQARKPGHEHRLQALLILLKVKSNLKLQWKLQQCTVYQVSDLLLLTDFIWQERAFLGQKFPKVGSLYGPGDSFKQLCFFEFIKAERHYLDFSQNPSNLELLDKMIAIMWRPAGGQKKVGDLRKRYQDETVSARAEIIKTWPMAQKLAIYLWFDSCRQNLIRLFPLVFPKVKQQGKFNPAARPKTWIDVATSLAENITNVKEVLYEDLFIVMLFLSNKIEETEELERQRNKK